MYPTKKQILSSKIKIPPNTIEIVKIWKEYYFTKHNWNKLTKENNLHNLKILILGLTMITNKKHSVLPIVKDGDSYKYNPLELTIYQDKNKPSIISALHELAHHLYGKSELTACRWSIAIFKKTFPKEYKKLSWKGHTLIKKTKK